jgi:hypothetical protein
MNEDEELNPAPDFSDVEGGSSSLSAEAGPPKQDISTLGKIGKTVARAATGVIQEVAETGAAASDVILPRDRQLSDLVTNPGERVTRAMKVEQYGNELRRKAFGEKEQGAWGMAEDFAQFGASMLIPVGWVGKLGRVSKVAKGLDKLSGGARLAVKAVGVEAKVEAKAAIGMDPVEQNLANLLTMIPQLQENTVLNALKSESNELNDRAENFASNMIAGGIIGKAIKGIKGGYMIARYGSKVTKQFEAASTWATAKAAHRAGKITDEQLDEVAELVENKLNEAQSLTLDNDHLRKGLADYQLSREGKWEIAVRAEAAVPGPVEGVVQNADGTWQVRGYRGVDASRDVLDPGVGGATFTSPDKELADVFSTNRNGEKVGNTFALEGTLSNPKVIESWNDPDYAGWSTPEYIDRLKGQGHDGLIIKTGQGGKPEVAFFGQDGIKVIGNADTEAEAIAKVFAHNEKLPLPADEELTMLSMVRQSIESGKNPFDADNLTNGVRFNFHYLGAPEGAKKVLLAMEETYQKLFEKGVVPNSATIQRAALELTGDKVAAKEVLSRSIVDPKLKYQLLAKRAMLRAQSIYVNGLSELVEREGGKVAENVDKLAQALHMMRENALVVAESQSETGRLLQSQAINPEKVAIGKGGKAEMAEQTALGSAADPVVASNPESFLAGKTPKEILLIARTLRNADPENAIDFVRALGDHVGKPMPKKGSPGWDLIQSIRYNSMLSSTKTQLINTLSNAAMMAIRPVELMSSGLIRQDVAAVREGRERFMSLASSWPEAWKMAKMAFKEGGPIADSASRENIEKVEFDSFLARMATLWGVPTKMLMSSDEFFKNMNYNAAVRGQAVREGMSRGLQGSDLAQYIDDTIKASRSPDGRFKNAQAIEYAREGTFTRDLAPDGLIAQAARKIEGDDTVSRTLRFFFPFIRTPANIFLAATERTPVLWAFSKRMREDLAGGGIRAAEARAKIDMGGVALSMAALAAGSVDPDGLPRITGGGPKRKDKLARDQKLSANWKPYSVKIGENYFSYQGLEPLSTILGTMADANEIRQSMTSAEQEKFMFAMSAAMIQNLSNKTFLQGIASMEDILSGEPAAVERALGNMARQMIPGAALQAEIAYVNDPYFREARGFVDKIKQGIPLWNETLEPKRNVFGEPLMKKRIDDADRIGGAFVALPFGLAEAEETESEEFIQTLQSEIGDGLKIAAINDKMKIGYTGKSLTDRDYWTDGSQRGTQSPYDRMGELLSKPEGKLRVGKAYEPLPPVKDFIKLVQAEDLEGMARYVGRGKARTLLGWSGLKDSGTATLDVTKADSRKDVLDKAFNLYHEAAFEAVQGEYPKLKAAVDKKADTTEAAKAFRKQTQRESRQRNSARQSFIDSGR